MGFIDPNRIMNLVIYCVLKKRKTLMTKNYSSYKKKHHNILWISGGKK